MKNIDKSVLICNDSSILFEEAFWHHTKHDKDIAIISNNYQLMRKLSVEYAERHYPGKWEISFTQMILRTPHGNIFFMNHSRMIATGIIINRGFILQDYNEEVDINKTTIKVRSRCRI